MTRKTIRSLSAGQIDTALSSIATFVIGIYAVRVFEATLLGAYVIVFTAWNLARTIPSQLVLLPSEVVAISQPGSGRIRVLDSSLRRGLLVSIVGAVGILGSIFLIQGDVGSEAALALVTTGAAVTILAPLQEHWRRMFHLSYSSWRAAITSTTHVLATVLSLLILDSAFEAVWVPFGSLAIGFLASSIVAVILTMPLRNGTHDDLKHPSWLELTNIGRWLLVASLSAVGSDFLVAIVAKAALGTEVLGYAEGARVVARPIVILGLGLAAVLGPRSMEAGLGRDHAKARRSRHLSWKVSLAGSMLYVPIVGWRWDLNPIRDLLPNAYAVDGLVALAAIGAVIFNIALPWTAELMGGKRQKDIAKSAMAGSIAKVAIGVLAPLWQAFTLPLAWTIGWSLGGIGLAGYARRLFAGAPTPKPESDQSI